ncbi:regulatory protein [Kitasatospora gansuensis]|uniref:Regulatory protein RecX n=1 Tax=Kitasatospora gansuensis TaxID=258050 RepID=A0A7W7WHD2_9ACTN|nr:regulatory protein RecX [Kitasatospora gansuensis]MBB4946575.1 regulatory protein [Kitasatospora gansuensis]
MTHESDAEVPGSDESGTEVFPGLLRASELTGGRRRRRTELAPLPSEQPAEPPEPKRRPKRERRAAAAPTDPAAQARDICLRLLTGTAKTRKQLADALRKKEIPDEVAAEVLDRYEEVGLIDDGAFAAAWVESRHAVRGLGRRALAQELRQRGVAGELVERALEQVDSEDEEEAARELVRRKLRTVRALDPQVRTRRLVGMLARRGYSEGLAFRAVKDVLAEED